MLTGRQAFAGESVTQVLFKVMSKEPEPVAGLVAGVPPAVEYVLARCLAKDVSRRYPDGRALADDIADVLAGRPPRGQAGWQPGPSPGGTLVAAAPTPVPAPPARTTVGARAAPQGAAPSGSRRTTLAVAAAAALAALVGGVAWLRNSAPETVARRVTVGPTPEPLPPGLPANTLPPADKPAAVPAQGFARLLIDFEHSLKSGLLRVWVDDQQVLEEPIGARVTREVAGIRFRKGRLSEALEVAAGRREIRVQVNWDDGTKTESAFANFKAGATRRLRVKFTNLAGLKRDLSLDWE
jgi:hypothetical protein